MFYIIVFNWVSLILLKSQNLCKVTFGLSGQKKLSRESWKLWFLELKHQLLDMPGVKKVVKNTWSAEATAKRAKERQKMSLKGFFLKIHLR